jgi:hypothetical protein
LRRAGGDAAQGHLRRAGAGRGERQAGHARGIVLEADDALTGQLLGPHHRNRGWHILQALDLLLGGDDHLGDRAGVIGGVGRCRGPGAAEAERGDGGAGQQAGGGQASDGHGVSPSGRFPASASRAAMPAN